MLVKEKQELLRIFGDRVAFHDIERMLYSSDRGYLPKLAKKQINANPDAVVQPNSLDDLRALVDLAAEYKIPLIPRGSGTAGLGGAVPVQGGIVVDFHRLCRIIDVNKAEKTVTVEGGVVWNDLEKELHGHGLALRLYPSSAISATVGGWLSNGGGVGIGSFEYGRIVSNAIDVTLVTPRGTSRLAGNDLYLVDGMAGTTGLIYQVTLMVREEDEDIPVLGAFRGLDDLLGAFEEIKSQKLDLWHIGFRDAWHVKLSHEAVKKQAKRSLWPSNAKEPGLPVNKLLATFVYPGRRHSLIADKLLKIIKAHGGEALDAELAGLEWDERFYPIRLKALGPSLIQSDAIIPTEKLSMLVKNIGHRIKGLTFDGSLINHGEETAIWTYALDDERRRGFVLAYPTNLITIDEAKRLGGKAYNIGMYLTDEAVRVFGKDRLHKIYEFKKEVDPDGIMNPGKVFPTTLEKNPSIRKLNRLIKLARSGIGTMRVIDRLVGGKTGGDLTDSKTVFAGLPFTKETEWDILACTGCGYCRSECPEFSAIGWESASPRGKFHLLKEYLKGNIALDERMAEMFFVCTTCRRCHEVCQVKAHIEDDWTWVARPAMLKEGFHPPLIFQRQAHSILFDHNPSGAPQSQRTAWMPPDLRYREEGNIGYFAGCAVSYTYQLRNLPINAFRVLNTVGIEPAYLGCDEWCCGGAMFNVGCIDEVSENVRHNIGEMKRRGIKTLITSCSACWYYLARIYPVIAPRLNLEYGISVKHITEVVSELIEEGRIKCETPVSLKVTYHDPCHIGRGGGIFEPPRKILASIPGLEFVEMPRNRECSACCGRHVVRYPRLGSIINSSRTNEAAQTGASAVVGSCPTCENNFRIGIAETGASLEVLDIIDLVAESAGLPRLAVSKLSKLLHSKR